MLIIAIEFRYGPISIEFLNHINDYHESLLSPTLHVWNPDSNTRNIAQNTQFKSNIMKEIQILCKDFFSLA